MTANEDDMPAQCIADPGSVLPRIPGETVARWGVRALRAKGLLSTRASIGPDSERIREAKQVIADAWYSFKGNESFTAVNLAERVATALRAAGLLPGPADIVVSREAVQRLYDFAKHEFEDPEIAAALAQPHPTQEQQT